MSSNRSPGNRVGGLILAAGRSRRMQGPSKLDVQLSGRAMIDRVIERFSPQVDFVAINGAADSNIVLPLIPDKLDGFRGPLTGLWSAFQHPLFASCDAIAVVPCDGPFLPSNLVETLSRAIADEDTLVATASYQGEMQPTFSLWRREAAGAVEEAVTRQGRGGLRSLIAELPHSLVSWPESQPSPFYNINNPDELAAAEKLIVEDAG